MSDDLNLINKFFSFQKHFLFLDKASDSSSDVGIIIFILFLEAIFNICLT